MSLVSEGSAVRRALLCPPWAAAPFLRALLAGGGGGRPGRAAGVAAHAQVPEVRSPGLPLVRGPPSGGGRGGWTRLVLGRLQPVT